MAKFPPRRPRAAAAGLAFAAVVALGFPLLAAQPAPPTETAPAAAPEAEPPADALAQRRATETPGETGLDDALAVEVERRFNDLRRELLDDRARTLDWWLMAVAIFLTLLGVVAVVAGYLGFKRFREIEDEARGNVDRAGEHAEEAQKLVAEIKKKRDEADSVMKEITAETAVAEPDKAAQSAQADPSAPLIDQAIAAAIRLQQRRDIAGAIEKWRAVANIADGVDHELGARARFSVGYLLQEDKPNDLESAIAAYDEAVRLKPDYAEAYNNRGNAKHDLDRHEDALADHDEAIRLKPDLPEAYNNRGNAKHDLGRHEDAIADYDEAVRLKPDLAEAYSNRGSAKARLGRHEDAIADHNEAIRLKPDYAEAYNNRGNAKHDLGRHEDAIADYDEAVRLKPDLAEAYSNRGSAKARLGRHEDAIADYDEAIRLNPDYAEAYYNRAATNSDLGREDETRRDLETALTLARAAGDETTADAANRALKQLSGGGDP